MVFDEERAFNAYNYQQAVGYEKIEAAEMPMNIQFSNLKDGPYAVVMFHDEDGNQDLTLDQQGYPAEGYGVSNATTKYDDLSFAQALVKAGVVEVKMFYPQ